MAISTYFEMDAKWLLDVEGDVSHVMSFSKLCKGISNENQIKHVATIEWYLLRAQLPCPHDFGVTFIALIAKMEFVVMSTK